MIRGVCFDMDGVLLDTERLGGIVMKEVAAMQDCPLTDAQWQALLGKNMEATKEGLRTFFPGKIDADRFIRDWCEVMMARIRREGLPFKPGAREVLARLRARGIRLALCTSNAAEVVAEYLRVAGWEHAFDQIITGDMIAHGKPAPDIYLRGAELLSLRPEECLGVEDSYSGVRAVRAAGMHCVMIPDILPWCSEVASMTDDVLTSLAELEPLLDKLNATNEEGAMTMTVKERFLRYIQVETTSVDTCETCPSSPNQWTLARMLVD
ncbi:MAG: HAD-IA family hydrolase, partial [Aristaeellaceae bacterium]